MVLFYISQITCQTEQFSCVLVIIFVNMGKFCKQQCIWYDLNTYALIFDEKKNNREILPFKYCIVL